MVIYEIIFHDLCYVQDYGASVGDGCIAIKYLMVEMILLLKRPNSNNGTDSAFINLIT